MSLRAFHIFFIMASIGMALLVGGWGVIDYVRNSEATHLYLGLTSLLGGVLLMGYAAWFIRKLKIV